MSNRTVAAFALIVLSVDNVFSERDSLTELFYGNTSRIVGGVDVPEGQYIPYQVSLQYRTNNGDILHFCGGSILSPTRVLTAAHCCKGLRPNRMSVVAGIRDLSDSSGQRSSVKSYDIHENYIELVTSDIAILSIDPPLSFDGERVAAINASGSEWVEGGQEVTLTGWGLRLPVAFPFLPSEWDSINYPTILQIMNYRTISNKECREGGMDQLTNTEICARGRFLKGACSGDSGGPLVMKTANGLKQIGIVSYGLIVCGVFNVPDVYTRVSEFDNWIRKRMDIPSETTRQFFPGHYERYM